MTWYPSVDDVIDANIIALDVSGDKHPHRLSVSRKAIESIIDGVRAEEHKGLTYQAARLMRDLIRFHPFDGGNHRAAYLVVKMFLWRNGMRLRVEGFEAAYSFIRGVRDKTIEEVRDWIEHGSSTD